MIVAMMVAMPATIPMIASVLRGLPPLSSSSGLDDDEDDDSSSEATNPIS